MKSKTTRLLAVPAAAGKRMLTGLSHLMLFLLMLLPGEIQAQVFTYTTNNGAITITGYLTGLGNLTIPSTINGLPVTSIGPSAFSFSSLTQVTIGNNVTNIGRFAFSHCPNLTRVTITNRVTTIGDVAFYFCSKLSRVELGNSVSTIGLGAFQSCYSLPNITIPSSVTSIGVEAFYECTSLTNVALDDGLTNIGSGAFQGCANLTRVTIPDCAITISMYAFNSCVSLPNITIGDGVASIASEAFSYCTNLTGLYFKGNAPSGDSSILTFADNSVVYYLPGTSGWETTFADRPTALWQLPTPLILNHGPSFGVQTNAFGFRISWATNLPVVVEACTNLAAPIWSPVATNTLPSGWSYFIDPEWTKYPSRIYRVRSL